MQSIQKQLDDILAGFNLSYQQILGEKFKLQQSKNNQQQKKASNLQKLSQSIEKKFKKFTIQQTDSNQIANDKINKMIDDYTKNYQISAKYFNRITDLKKIVDQSQKQRDTANRQRQMLYQLHKGFKSKYQQELKKAQQVQKSQEIKRKQVIQSLQQKIKTIQTQYQQAGKNKIEKYRQNQQLKHQTMKLEPHFMASQSLYQAQLKKKAIQIEIQMTTLKQKIQMMDNFKGMKTQTIQKTQKAKIQQEKINLRLKKITEKQDQHKILLARAHLIFEDYKKAIHTLKNVLPKQQKQASVVRLKANKTQTTLKQLKKQLNDLETEYENQIKQKQVLQTLQSNLNKQLQEAK